MRFQQRSLLLAGALAVLGASGFGTSQARADDDDYPRRQTVYYGQGYGGYGQGYGGGYGQGYGGGYGQGYGGGYSQGYGGGYGQGYGGYYAPVPNSYGNGGYPPNGAPYGNGGYGQPSYGGYGRSFAPLLGNFGGFRRDRDDDHGRGRREGGRRERDDD